MDIISGFEAKILVDGTLDCLDEYLQNYFIIASFHTRYDKTLWLELIQKVVQNPQVDVVGHLGPDSTWPVPLDMDELKMTASMIARHGKKIELNAKYHRPPRDWLQVFKQQGISFHLASDAHSLDEIGQYQGISDLVAIVDDGGKSEIENDLGRKSLS